MFVTFGLGACADESSAADAAASTEKDAAQLEQVALLDHSGWQHADVRLDPLASHQPEEIRCGLAGYYLERGELELDTGSCDYLYLEHPTLHAIRAGTEVQLVFRHFDLTAPEPAQAHIAVLFGDSLQWETMIDVPGAAAAFEVSWRSSEALAEAAPIRVHLHNHGQNTWILSTLSALVPQER